MVSLHRPERSGLPDRRRSTASGYRENSAPYPRNRSVLSVRTSDSSNASRNVASQQHQEQQSPDTYNFFDPEVAQTWTSSFAPIIYRNGDQRESPGPPALLAPASSAFLEQMAPQFDDAVLYSTYVSLSSPGSNPYNSWDIATPSTSYMGTGNGDSPLSNGPSGTYGSLDDITVSTPDTLASGFSDGSVNFRANSVFGSPASNSASLVDMKLSDSYFQCVNPHDTSFGFDPGQTANNFQLDMDYLSSMPSDAILNEFSAGCKSWTSDDFGLEPFVEHTQSGQFSMQTLPPWDSEYGHFEMDANPGIIAFEPPRGVPFEIYQTREALLNQSPPADQTGWQEQPTKGGYVGEGYGQSQSPPVFGPQVSENFSEEALELHSHIFSSVPGVEIPRSHTGRTRKLTPEQKEQTKAVRQARACWACRLSKQKCSPCSSDSPCEQCKALVGKRRFVKIPCFNDPIESLYTFLVPEYLMGHFSESNIESFIKKHSVGWLNHEFPVRLSWGGRRLLPVTVSALRMRDGLSEIGFNNQSFVKDGRPKFVRRNSPPLGIPLASIEEMQEEYSNHVREVVVNDLDHYVSIAYEGQRSSLPKLLLQAVCLYYQMSVETKGAERKTVKKRSVGAVNECWLLRRALEIHITSTILEKSLILDEISAYEVQAYLGQQFPSETAPRCAQRQIKLAFYLGQRQRIVEVLTEWGRLMQNMSSSDKRWTTAFCVFMVLVLVMDKMIGAAYRRCESRALRNEGDPVTERTGFENLVRLTECELFERCKEIFHIRYKTRKGWNERINPIRDGFEVEAWKGQNIDEKTTRLVADLRGIMRNLGQESADEEAAAASLASAPQNPSYNNAGRLASIFLGDFLNIS